MTDKEIIKALEEHIENTKNIKNGARKVDVVDAELLKDALDLINRQHSRLRKEENKNKKLRNERNWLKAEIENLKKSYEIYEESSGLKWAKAEAIKEFAKRFIDKVADIPAWGSVAVKKIDNLVKELTEVKDDDT